MKGILKFLSNSGKPKVNNLGDIDKIPKQNGVLVFPISMAKIETELSAKNIFKFLEEKIHPKWQNYPVSIFFLYTDDVYLKYGFGDKFDYKNKVLKHKSDSLNIINSSSYLTKDAFSFIGWNEFFIFDSKTKSRFDELKNIYLSDKKFQDFMSMDLKRAGREFNSTNSDFLLEEMILPYLFVKNGFDFQDNFTKNFKRFKLICYSGNPLNILHYIVKMDFFNLDKSNNVFQNCFYNLKTCFLFNFDEIELGKYKDLGTYIVDFRKKD